MARLTGAKLLAFDRGFGSRFVAGADEAGRGPLAGPLVVAGVLLDLDELRGPRARPLAYLNDSKQVGRAGREDLYRAVLAAQEKDGVLHEESSTEFSLATKAHAASVNVWGLPSAIAAGERFRLKVGIKCSAGCQLTGRQLSIFDDEGAQVGAGSLLDDIWPGTSALYFAEVEAEAPRTTGDYKWQVKTPVWDSGVPHAAGSFTFAVKVVSPPDHEVTVEAFDSEKQTPIKGAHVLLHPYRALTDETGVAKVKVAKGRYTLFVSGFKYVAHQNIIDVTGDVTTRAELTVEPEGQEDYR